MADGEATPLLLDRAPRFSPALGLGACQQRRLWLRGLQTAWMEYLQCPRGALAKPVPSTSSQTAGSKGGVRQE